MASEADAVAEDRLEVHRDTRRDTWPASFVGTAIGRSPGERRFARSEGAIDRVAPDGRDGSS